MPVFSGPTVGSLLGDRNNNFTLLRLCAAFLVVLAHGWVACTGGDADLPLMQWLGVGSGWVGVAMFFVISGFFISRSFETRGSLTSFVAARCLRIFPGLVVTLVVTVLVASFLTAAPAKVYWGSVPIYLAANAFLIGPYDRLAGVFVGLPVSGAINISLWTLPYEALCYMLVILIGATGALRDRRRFAVIGAALLAVYLAPSVAGSAPVIDTLFFQFGIGASFWVWKDRIRLSPGLFVLLCLVTASARHSFLYIPLLTASIAYLTFWIGFAPIPVLSVFRRVGDYSYGVYLYGFPIQQILVQSGVVSPLWNVLFALPLALGCAAMSWHFVEKPALGFKALAERRPVTIQANP